MKMNLKEETLSQQTLYEGKIINLRRDTCRLPNGREAVREVVEHPGGVCVAALCGDGQVLLVRQFRYPYMEEILEIPAGKLNKGEDPLECGKRELKEETGAVAVEYRFLGELYPSPGYCGEIIYMYLAKVEDFQGMNPDDDEFLEVIRRPLEDVVQDILQNKIKDSKTQTAILKVAALKAQGLL